MAYEFKIPTGETVTVDDEDVDIAKSRAWHKAGRYVQGWTKGSASSRSREYLHRIIGAQLGIPEVDHKDHDPMNNRRDNLRPATRAQNCANTSRAVGSSGARGVKFDKRLGKFVARIGQNNVHLGTFSTLAEAVAVRDAAALKRYGEFAVLNKG